MPAITIKLEGELLSSLRAILPEGESIASFARSVLAGEVRRQRSRAAADEYAAFLAEDPIERQEVAQWQSAELAAEPRPA